MQLNNAGEIAKATWNELPARFPSLGLDAFVAMPNHIHGIIMVGAQFIAPSDGFGETNQGVMNHAPTLGKIIRAYKAASTRLIRQAGTPDFAWQRNYYEHVIRDEESLNRIRQYILDNPAIPPATGLGSRRLRSNPGKAVLNPVNVSMIWADFRFSFSTGLCKS